MVLLYLSSSFLLEAKPVVSRSERLAAFPRQVPLLEKPLTIYWSPQLIPFIEATSDGDLAVALGLVHAHLRSGQMAFFRRVAQGRLAETGGPWAVKIDQALRILNFGQAAPAIVAAMDGQTRQFLLRYVEGLNWYQAHVSQRPPGWELLGLTDEPWTLEDLVTFGRLAGSDVNWFSLFALLPEMDKAHWPRLWEETRRQNLLSPPSFATEKSDLRALATYLLGHSRSGSNAIAVGAERSTYGCAMIANDPHLGTQLPNFWMVVGMRSPSYHTVGLMIPGLPFVALGRNPWLAWGGTNMRSAATDLYDVSGLPPESFTCRQETIKVRWWFDKKITVRDTPWGPVLSDAEIIPGHKSHTFALQWVGHQVSDEIGAFLRANRARSLEEFREAFRGYAVSGQNLLAVDTFGRIGMHLATRLPIRQWDFPPGLLLDPRNPEHQWKNFIEGPDLPWIVQPADGYLASANNCPVATRPPINIFYGPSERLERIRELFAAKERWSMADLQQLQTDVYSLAALRLSRQLVRFYSAADSSPLLQSLQSWDGNYTTDSKGAVALETLLARLVEQHEKMLDAASHPSYLRKQWSYLNGPWLAELAALPPATLKKLADAARKKAEEDFRRYENWGAMHRQRIQHYAANVPLLGGKFRAGDYPAPGSRETLCKSAHGLESDQLYTSYGSQARHISLMDDPDHNWFVLLGGQDEWWGAENALDQIPAWREGRSFVVPLRLETIRTLWKDSTTCTP